MVVPHNDRVYSSCIMQTYVDIYLLTLKSENNQRMLFLEESLHLSDCFQPVRDRAEMETLRFVLPW